MTDTEKVINGLRCLSDANCIEKDCDNCKYDFASCVLDVSNDALQLLKEQEHKPLMNGYWIHPTTLDCCCSICGEQPEREPGASVPLYNYCPYCGAKMEVKWDES